MKKWMALILMTIFCAGCSAEVTEKNLGQIHFVKANAMVGDKTPAERAMAIKSRLKQLEGVGGSAVVVEGHTAIIGLRLEENMEQMELSRVKKEADAAAKEADEYIESTSITTNTYIVSLIEEMERGRAG